MDKSYQPQAVEKAANSVWQQLPKNTVSSHAPESFCMMLPPPNVTGSLHMGHAFQQTIMDFLFRYHKMQGRDTHLQVGLDHSGIAAQMVVERLLLAEGIQRHDIGKEAFNDRVWQWKEQSGGRILDQMQILGISGDRSRERFTMDDGFCDAVNTAFVQLYRDKLIYRRKKLVNWDTQLQTAISDLEVVNTEKKGTIWYFKYPLKTPIDNQTHISIATTRPETILGDTAIAVNPKDIRYQKLIGSSVMLPLTNREIPIIADHYVDMDFGSGCVKMTPAHDFNDYQVGERHKLDMVNILSKSGHILPNAEVYHSDGSASDNQIALPANLVGKNVKQARQEVVAMMQAADLLVQCEDHSMAVPIGDRSNQVIEPLLTDQWFVTTKPLAKRAIEAVENGDIAFIPNNYRNMYNAWMHQIQDWCISRQLWWGHQIPAWYDTDRNIYVGHSEDDVRQHYQLPENMTLEREDSVLDTWFSSGLWTFATLGWPKQTDALKKWHPTDVLVTGFDIIFFWVARMIMLTLHLTNQIPFKKVYVTGLIRDEQGHKMSKTKGNVIDPIDMVAGIALPELVQKATQGMMQPQLAKKVEMTIRKNFPKGIEAHGVDALRITLLALASRGRDINWDMQRLNGYRNFCNKIWNASRYVIQSVSCPKMDNTIVIDHPVNVWILEQYHSVYKKLEHAIAEFRFDEYMQHLHDFIWHSYCDWYIEFSKYLLANANDKLQTEQTLLIVLKAILKQLHPAAPFLTEAIYQQMRHFELDANNQSIATVVNDMPKVASNQKPIVTRLQQIVIATRQIRTENGVHPKNKVQLHLRVPTEDDIAIINNYQYILKPLLKVDSIALATNAKPFAKVSKIDAVQKVDDISVMIPLEGVVDLSKEIERLQRELTKITKAVAQLEAKLSNANFTANAPKQLVVDNRQLLAKQIAKQTEIKQKLQLYDTN